MFKTLLPSFLIIGFALASHAEEPRFRPLTVELLSEYDAIQPGQRFHVGIRQTILPGYHSYWRSPGTVGMPMHVDWKLPKGFTAGELLWPLPNTGKMAAYSIWGHHTEALLVVAIQAPKDLKPGSTVTLKAAARWMCCGKSCYPDSETLQIELPVKSRATDNPTVRAAIAETLAVQPRPSKRWKLSAKVKGKRYTLIVKPANPDTPPPGQASFFDYDRQISSDKGQRTSHSKKALRITLFQEENTGDKLPRLRGMLVAEHEWEPGLKALAVDVPISGRQP